MKFCRPPFTADLSMGWWLDGGSEMGKDGRKSWRIDPSHDHPFHQSPEAFQALLRDLTCPTVSVSGVVRTADEGRKGGEPSEQDGGTVAWRTMARTGEGVAVEQLIDWQANLEERERSLSLREAELARAWVLLKERQAVFEREARGLLTHLSQRIG